MLSHKSVLLVVFLAALPLLSTCSKESTSVPKQSKKLALLVGISEYKCGYSPLKGPTADVDDMKDLLVNVFQFAPADIRILKNSEATHEAIVKTFQEHLVGNADVGATAVFYFSGHGSQMPDSSGDESDGLDETIVPFDTRVGDVYDISDDEINGLLKLLSQKTRNITVIIDACHSGSVARGVGVAKDMPKDERTPPPPPPYALSEKGMHEADGSMKLRDVDYALVSACLSEQKAYELPVQRSGEPVLRGALTWFFTTAVRTLGTRTTYREIMENASAQMARAFVQQTPQVSGAGADHYLFSDSMRTAIPYVLARPEGIGVRISAGEIHGVTEGSTFDVYPPLTNDFGHNTKPTAKVRVRAVKAFTADCSYDSGKGVVEGARAIERAHQFGSRELWVFIRGLDQSTTLQAVKRDLAQYGFIKFQDTPAQYHMLLREEKQSIVIEGADTIEMAPRVPLGPTAAAQVADLVKRQARWFDILSIQNPSSQCTIEFTVRAIGKGGARDPYTLVGKPENVFAEDEIVDLTVKNTSKVDLYCAIVDLVSDGRVLLLKSWDDAIAAGSSQTHQVRAELEPGVKYETDVLKVFASGSKIDFSFLRREPVKATDDQIGSTPLQELVSRHFGATVNVNDWTTVHRVATVVRKQGK